MIDNSKAVQRLLQENDYQVNGKITQTGCTFSYPPRHLPPYTNGFHRDYRLTPTGVSITLRTTDKTVDNVDIECPVYARKACILADVASCCVYLQYNTTLICLFVNDVETDEKTFMQNINGGTKETPQMLQKEHALNTLLLRAYTDNFTKDNSVLAQQLGVLDGYQTICQLYLRELQQ